MKRTVAVLVAGLIAGAILGATIPAGAHHNDDRFKNRLNRLENSVATLKSQMTTVRNRTALLTTDGVYYGPLFGYQVLGFCTEGTTAMWEVSEVDASVQAIDDCYEAQQMRKRALNLREWAP